MPNPRGGGLKARLAMYQSHVQSKKDENYRTTELAVGSLNPDDLDINSYLRTPSGGYEKSKISRELAGLHVALSLSPRKMGLSPGKSGYDGDDSDDDDVSFSFQPRGKNKLGDSFVKEKSQEVKDKEEAVAKDHLGELLDEHHPEPKKKEGMRIMSFVSVRKRYIEAVNNLTPEHINVQAPLQQKKEKILQEAEKQEKYGDLKNAWDNYEEVAQDKPVGMTKAEIAEQEALDEAEDKIEEKWTGFAENVVECFEEEEEEDDELDFWVQEAKRLKEEAAARRKRKKDKRKKAEQKYWKEEAEKMRNAAQTGNGVAGNPYESDEEDSEDSDDSEEEPAKEKAKKEKEKAKKLEKEKERAKKEKEKAKKEKEQAKKLEKEKEQAKKLEKEKAKKEKDKAKKEKEKTKKEKEKEKAKKGKDKKSSGAPRNLDGTLWRNPLRGWSNRPSLKSIKEKGTQISFKVPTKTDCWRKTRHNFVMDNAPFNWHKVSGDFEVMVNVSGELSSPYDKAGLQVRVDDENWILSGMEMYNGKPHSSTCITKDFTDWSLAPLPDASEKDGVWFCIKRVGSIFETYYSVDCAEWVMTRQCSLSDRPVLQVGICAAAPVGEDYKVVFDYYRVKTI